MAGPYTRRTVGNTITPVFFNELQEGIEEHETRLDAAESALDNAVETGEVAELARDAVGTALTAGSGVSKTVDDGSDTITVAVDSTVIRTTGNQSMTGTKTFSSPPVVPTPTANGHATTKSYVDTAVGGKANNSLLSASGLGTVNHGATAGTARPTGWAAVLWIGSVEPTNMANGDIWIET